MIKHSSSNTLRSRGRLRGQVAVITGASRGIGVAIAHTLAAEGCNLVLTARDESALTRLSRELASAKIKILAQPCEIRATRVFAGSAAYNASKHGALGLTNTLREELRPRGIRVIALLPGATDTDIWTTLWPQAPRRKMMSPQTIAQAIVQAIVLPPNATVERLEIRPTAGTL